MDATGEIRTLAGTSNVVVPSAPAVARLVISCAVGGCMLSNALRPIRTVDVLRVLGEGRRARTELAEPWMADLRRLQPRGPAREVSLWRPAATAIVEAFELGPHRADAVGDPSSESVARLSELLHGLSEFGRRGDELGLHILYGKSALEALCEAVFGGDLRLTVALGKEKVPARRALVVGETGVGKERVARLIGEHVAALDRPDAPFLAFNASMLTGELARAELFGHERGAFTGATKARGGLIERAKGGTLFLDEIGDLDLGVQRTLLRFLQEGTFHRVGSPGEEEARVHIVGATNREPDQLRSGDAGFRSDLFFRLSQVVVQLPPVRVRAADGALRAILEHVLSFEMADVHRALVAEPLYATRLDALRARSAVVLAEALSDYAWPGNLREVGNIARHLMHRVWPRIDAPRSKDADRLIAAFAAEWVGRDPLSPSPQPSEGASEDGPAWRVSARALEQARPVGCADALALVERAYYAEAFAESGGNVSRTAEALGVSRGTASRTLERHGLKGARSRAASSRAETE
jgi:DNA-binding NtrC family response regulator